MKHSQLHMNSFIWTPLPFWRHVQRNSIQTPISRGLRYRATIHKTMKADPISDRAGKKQKKATFHVAPVSSDEGVWLRRGSEHHFCECLSTGFVTVNNFRHYSIRILAFSRSSMSSLQGTHYRVLASGWVKNSNVDAEDMNCSHSAILLCVVSTANWRMMGRC